jgi:phosphotransferase system enzyme I (PtsP)
MTEKATYRITGLDCAEEARELKKTVGALPGVISVEFDAADARMNVSYDADAIDPERIVSTVSAAGMTASPLSPARARTAPWMEHAVRLLLHGVAGGILGFLFFHPASRVFHALLSEGGFSLTQTFATCFSSQHLPLAMYFGLLGFAFGLLQGIYSQHLGRLAHGMRRLSGEASLTLAYERIFRAPAHAQLPTATTEARPGRAKSMVVRGKGASSGYAAGPAKLFNVAAEFASFFEAHVTDIYSVSQFEDAVAATVEQIGTLGQHARQRLGDGVAMIFDAQIMLLQDPAFAGSIEEMVRRGEPAAKAILDVTTRHVDTLSKSGNAYLQDKAQDLKDIGLRLLHNLTGEDRGTGFADRIVVAPDLFPSDLLQLTLEGALGIVLLSGGMNSHVVILARSLGLPLVIAEVETPVEALAQSRLLIDGSNGELHVNPAETAVESMKDKHEAQVIRGGEATASFHEPPRTRDGTPISVKANLNVPTGLDEPTMRGSEGVGLCRTEFAFVGFRQAPTEEEQYRVYRDIAEKAPRQDVTFRAFDLGGDKAFWGMAGGGENPLLGVKSTRLLLRNRDVLVPQLRALLRATSDVPTKIMFPMISSMEEFLEARQAVRECLDALRNEGISCNGDIQIGLMIETPAALMMIDELCEQADFLSLGTNDLVQYLLAADRSKGELAEYSVPHHPAVLRAIKRIAAAATEHGTPLCVCGDMAHESSYLPYLLGVGIRELSVEPSYIPQVRTGINATDIGEAEDMATRIHRESDIAIIETLLKTDLAPKRKTGG